MVYSLTLVLTTVPLVNPVRSPPKVTDAPIVPTVDAAVNWSFAKVIVNTWFNDPFSLTGLGLGLAVTTSSAMSNVAFSESDAPVKAAALMTTVMVAFAVKGTVGVPAKVKVAVVPPLLAELNDVTVTPAGNPLIV